MSGLMARIQGGTKPLLWLDDADYAERLLSAGRTPWCDGAAYLAFRRKAHGLLKPDLWALPLSRMLTAWVDAHPALRQAMSAKPRLLVPARTLLADAALRTYLADLLGSLQSGGVGDPLLLAMPSPRALIRQAWQLAFDAAPEDALGEDEIDTCAVYVADFLRSFAATDIAGLLLEEDADDAPASADEVAWYQPVLNVATHFRWAVGLSVPDGCGCVAAPLPAQFVIAPQSLPVQVPQGRVLADDFWTGAAPPATTMDGFFYARVPADAVPEQVLARLSVLRNLGESQS
jgi:hypothetical protein